MLEQLPRLAYCLQWNGEGFTAHGTSSISPLEWRSKILSHIQVQYPAVPRFETTFLTSKIDRRIDNGRIAALSISLVRSYRTHLGERLVVTRTGPNFRLFDRRPFFFIPSCGGFPSHLSCGTPSNWHLSTGSKITSLFHPFSDIKYYILYLNSIQDFDEFPPNTSHWRFLFTQRRRPVCQIDIAVLRQRKPPGPAISRSSKRKHFCNVQQNDKKQDTSIWTNRKPPVCTLLVPKCVSTREDFVPFE